MNEPMAQSGGSIIENGVPVRGLDSRRLRYQSRLRCACDDRPRLPPLDRRRSAGRGRGARLDDPRRRRPRVPRRRRRRDRRQRRSRPARDRGRDGRAGRPSRLRPRQRLHHRAARGVRRARSRRTCPSTTRRSTRSPAAPRRSRRRSSSPGPTTSPAASPTAGSSSPAGGATTATRSARSTCPAASRSAGRTRAGSAGSGTCPRPTRTGPAMPGANALGHADELAAELDADVRGGRAGHGRRVRRRADRRGDARPRSCRRTATGRRSPRSAAATASCSIADEVMTGFGRTGRWFGVDHWGVRPDILVAAKGATSGYWPFGFVAASGGDPRRRPGTAPASSTGSPTRTRRSARPSPARSCGSSRTKRSSRRARPRASGCEPCDGRPRRQPGRRRDPRPRPDGRHRAGRGPRDARAVPASARSPRRSSAAARERGVLVYSGTGNANGVDGDTILLGPPFVVTDAELARIVEVLAEAIEVATAAPDRAAASIPS